MEPSNISPPLTPPTPNISEAYRLISKADKLNMQEHFQEATDMYKKGAAEFGKASQSTTDNEAKKALLAIERQYKFISQQVHLKAEFLGREGLNGKESHGARRASSSPGVTKMGSPAADNKKFPIPVAKDRLGARPDQASSIVTSLANARGIPHDRVHPVRKSSPASNKLYPNDELFNRYFMSLDSAIVNTMSKPLEKTAKKQSRRNAGTDQNLTSNTGRSTSSLVSEQSKSSMGPDAFYIISPPPTDKTADELSMENSHLRSIIDDLASKTQAYEQNVAKLRQIVKTSVTQLRNEVKTVNSERQKDYEEELEYLRSENEKLKIQMGRLKSKWEGIRESAKKRRNTEHSSESPVPADILAEDKGRD